MPHLLRICDLTLDDVDRVIARAAALEQGAEPRSTPFTAALVFLTPSLRTRIGFATAVLRLGGHPLDVHEARWSTSMSSPESFGDTIRTLCGMVDVLVTRTPQPLDPLDVARSGSVPVVNGGEGRGEHPTQALIDLAAIRRQGPVSERRIGIIGDLGARSVRSLVAILGLDPPAELRLLGPTGAGDVSPSSPLASCTNRSTELDLSDLDVIYLAGLPEMADGSARSDQERQAFALTEARMDGLRKDAVVLCPLPIIDEMDPAVRHDHRVQMFAQSDRGLHVRTAILEHVLER